MKGEGGGNEASWNTELKGCSLQGRAVVSGSQLPWVSWADGLLSGPGCWGWAYLVLLGASVQVRCTRGCSDLLKSFFFCSCLVPPHLLGAVLMCGVERFWSISSASGQRHWRQFLLPRVGSAGSKSGKPSAWWGKCPYLIFLGHC